MFDDIQKQLDNLEMSNSDFMETLMPFMEGAELQDPQIGHRFRVTGIEVDKKNIFAKVGAGFNIELNPSDEKIWFKEVLLYDMELRNKKEILEYLLGKPEDVNERLEELETTVEITVNNSGKILGSIATSYERDLKDEFRTCMDTSTYSCYITEMNKGGYIGHIDGVEVFIPGSLASHKRIDTYSDLVGKMIPVMIDGYVKERDIYIASNKKYIKKITPQLLDEIDSTQMLDGVISGIAPFGIFVSFGEFFGGLIHTSEMKPETLDKFNQNEYEEGQDIRFYIKSYNDSKVILSEFSEEETKKAWQNLTDKYMDEIIPVKPFKRITSGYLCEIDDNVIGLLYESEARNYGTRIELNQEYYVRVKSMDEETGKIYLTYYR